MKKTMEEKKRLKQLQREAKKEDKRAVKSWDEMIKRLKEKNALISEEIVNN